jgi:oligopeptide transport system substrate-binding protein
MVRLAAIPLVLLALLVASLVWSDEGWQGRADFAFVLKGDHVTLDLNNLSYAIDLRLAESMWEGLYTLDPATLRPVLGTADRFDVSPDRRVYTFHIRRGARWSNGDPVVAGDFLFEWRRMLETPKEYSYLHAQYIRGAAAYEAAYADYARAPKGSKPPAPDFRSVGERVNPDGTLRLELINPVPFLPALLAFAPFYPMHEPSMRPFEQVDARTGQVTYDPKFTQPPNLVTNGPFRLASWAFKRRVRLAANPFYWDKDHVRCQTIDEIRADDGLAAYRLYEQGDVDWLADVDPDLAAPIFAQRRPDLHVFPSFGTSYYELNCLPKLPDGRPNPLVDVRVRQALAMSIDKRQIVDEVGRLGQPVATDFIPPGVFPGYASPPGLPYDVDRAKRLMADAGYPGGHGFPRLSILFATEASINGDVATIIRRQWADHLGIDVDPNGMEQKQAAADLNHQQYSIARAAWYGDYFDPSTFTDKYLSTADNNAAKWADPQYDAFCAQAATEADPAKRMADFHNAEDRLLTQAPIVPLYTYVGTFLYRPSVHGITPNAQGNVMFKGVWTDHMRAVH